MPSPVSGTVVKIHAAEGDTVAVGALLAEISVNGASAPVAAEHFGISEQMVTYRVNVTGARMRVARARGLRVVR